MLLMSWAHSAVGGGTQKTGPRNRRFSFGFKSAPRGPRGEGEGEGEAPGACPRNLRASAGASGTEVGAMGPARKYPAGRKKHYFILLYKGLRRRPERGPVADWRDAGNISSRYGFLKDGGQT